MRRRLALALLLGLLTTVGVSWAAMRLPLSNNWYGPPSTQSLGTARTPDMQYWQLSRGEHPAHTVVTYWFMQISGMAMWVSQDDYHAAKYDWESLPAHYRPEQLEDLNMLAWYHSTGWPFRALGCSVHWERQIMNSNITYRVEGGVQLPRDDSFNPRALPLTPLWPGFAVNVVFYGLLWSVPVFVLPVWRRRWRESRGVCPRCRYSMAGLDAGAACPECGWSSPR